MSSSSSSRTTDLEYANPTKPKDSVHDRNTTLNTHTTPTKRRDRPESSSAARELITLPEEIRKEFDDQCEAPKKRHVGKAINHEMNDSDG